MIKDKQINGNTITKTLHCEYCNRNVSFTIRRRDLEELKNNQLFNFVIVHAKDHAIVVSIDGFGNIRRTRVAMISELPESLYDRKLSEEELFELESVDNLADALKSFLNQ